jgi:hypothetical protein
MRPTAIITISAERQTVTWSLEAVADKRPFIASVDLFYLSLRFYRFHTRFDKD